MGRRVGSSTSPDLRLTRYRTSILSTKFISFSVCASVMESHKYVTILLLVCGIFEGYSHPQSNESLSPEAVRTLLEEMSIHTEGSNNEPLKETAHEMDIAETEINYQNAARIKRDKKPDGIDKSNKANKSQRLAGLMRPRRIDHAAIQRYLQVVQQYQRTIDQYIEQGLTQDAAIARFESEHSDLADQLVHGPNQGN
ncbi:uncharacterized protein [Venturia canescens]|uniref:uncharacterized protein isoform X2 n=1 Tax=Venturia canescens TaxID=32260 RepID=UPI001C9BE630|nr:uncharacterized protein LOC122411991 isoform X2 [Venturia canescens]